MYSNEKEKNTKIYLIIGIIISLLILVYIALVIFNILPNPFLDTKDLVCIRYESAAEVYYEEENIITFKFDKWAKVKSYVDELTTKRPDLIIKQEGKNVISISNYNVEFGKGYYNYTKKQLKEMYEKEFNFVCE